MSHDAWISQSAERKIDPHKHVGDERKRLLQEDALLIKDGCNIMLDHPSFMDHSLFRCQSVAVHKSFHCWMTAKMSCVVERRKLMDHEQRATCQLPINDTSILNIPLTNQDLLIQ